MLLFLGFSLPFHGIKLGSSVQEKVIEARISDECWDGVSSETYHGKQSYTSQGEVCANWAEAEMNMGLIMRIDLIANCLEICFYY